NYELDSYLDALDEFPSMETTFETEKGKAACMKIDVFKREMWFTYVEGGITWYKFTLDQAKEFIAISKKGEKTSSLEDLANEASVEVEKEFKDVIQENSLERFERKNRNRNRKNRPRSNRDSNNPKSERPQRSEKTQRSAKPQSGEKQARNEKRKFDPKKQGGKAKPQNTSDKKPDQRKAKPNPNKEKKNQQRRRNNRNNPNKNDENS